MLSEQHWYKWFREDISHICLCGNVLDIYLTLNHCLPRVMEAHCHMLGVLGIHCAAAHILAQALGVLQYPRPAAVGNPM